MANLERCLRSVLPHIACWVVGDTGSKDGTQDYICSFFAGHGVPGKLHEFPFVDFAQARNEALERARTSDFDFDYLLLTDADMELSVQDPTSFLNPTADVYRMVQRCGITYWNSRLLRRGVAASYKGVTHEFLDVPGGKVGSLAGAFFIDHASGTNRAEKYERDVRLLRSAIAAESDPSMIARYTFYLANTLRDFGQSEAALTQYMKRTRLGHGDQEVFLSLYSAAKLKEAIQYPTEDVLAAYTEATAVCPTRAEALHGAARFCRHNGLYDRGRWFARKGLAISYPPDALFVNDWIYEYGLLDELAINAYWTGRYEECIAACERILKKGSCRRISGSALSGTKSSDWRNGERPPRPPHGALWPSSFKRRGREKKSDRESMTFSRPTRKRPLRTRRVPKPFTAPRASAVLGACTSRASRMPRRV